MIIIILDLLTKSLYIIIFELKYSSFFVLNTSGIKMGSRTKCLVILVLSFGLIPEDTYARPGATKKFPGMRMFQVFCKWKNLLAYNRNQINVVTYQWLLILYSLFTI